MRPVISSMIAGQAEETEHHGGRPLDATRDVALREATLELLAEIGYDRLTIDAVAARARASKTTIYRRWSGKAELVVDALNSLKAALPVPDTGSLRGDLETIAQHAGHTDNQFGTQLMIGMITALARDDELRRVFREGQLDPSRTGLKQIFERAVARGEIPADRDLDMLISLLSALAIQHLLTYGETPDQTFATRVIDDVILPLATAPATPSAPRHP